MSIAYSVCSACIVTKQYVLPKKLSEQVNIYGCPTAIFCGTKSPKIPLFLPNGRTECTQNTPTCIVNYGQTASASERGYYWLIYLSMASMRPSDGTIDVTVRMQRSAVSTP